MNSNWIPVYSILIGALLGGVSGRVWIHHKKKQWWYPWKSPEAAYDFDHVDAILEYMKRSLPDVLEGRMIEYPWSDSEWQTGKSR